MSIQSVGAEVLKASLNSLHRANEFASPIASEVIKKLSVISTQSINNGIPSDLVGPGCFIGCVAMTIAYGKHKAMRSEKSGKTRTANERSESPATTNCSPISASNVGSEYSPIEKERSFSQDSLEGERNTNDAKKKLTMLSHKNKKKHDDATLSDTTSRSLVSTTATPATTHATASTGTLFSGDSTQRDLYNNYGHTPYARSGSPAHSSSRLPAPSPSARSSDNMNVTLIDGEGAPIPHGAAMAVRYPKSQYVAQRPMIVRFPLNGNNKEDAFYYFRNRTTEALVEGLVLQVAAATPTPTPLPHLTLARPPSCSGAARAVRRLGRGGHLSVRHALLRHLPLAVCVREAQEEGTLQGTPLQCMHVFMSPLH